MTNESVLWRLSCIEEINQEATLEFQPLDPEPQPITPKGYLITLKDLPKEEQAQLLRSVFPNLSVSQLIGQSGWTGLRHWLKPENKRNKVRTDQKKWADQRREFINSLKACGCQVCGYNKCFAALEFHHLDPKVKEKRVSQLSSEEKIKEEIKKCVVLCSNCHREVHQGLIILS